ncbi:hypothetical protein A0H81_01222 [Grifola frondosa]|uniref:PB1 domain-containing protein n=1 Tax=Grifola frondosa TaxID=5627 RepID=A0A1C7MSD9_GRIFR|nr:hypothetical protein A0H81_01222 [Grifola frondosa]
MSSIQIKLVKPPDGLTRRVTFTNKPSWIALAAKIESLYGIKLANVAVSYVDTDGDEVTLSSEEELQEFYKSADAQKQIGSLALVKFTVRDLGALWHKPLPEPPRMSGYRNTFGRGVPMMFEMEMDDDWQRVPAYMGGPMREPETPHGFVESIVSERMSRSRRRTRMSPQ